MNTLTTLANNGRGIVGYELVDGHTGKVLATYSVAQRRAARNRADKLDRAYGAHRYSACPVIAQLVPAVEVGR